LHEHVRKALVSDGWTITHDPLRLRWRKKDVTADLGAERFVGAEKGPIRIAVEIKSFTGPRRSILSRRRSGSSPSTTTSWRGWIPTVSCTSR
jgi:hypothetical protein